MPNVEIRKRIEMNSTCRRPVNRACLLLVVLLASVRGGHLLAAEPQLLADELLADGWIQLFDGQTLFGWAPASDANWRVEEGAIVVDEGDRGLLCTTSRFHDFVLHLQFRSPQTTNSGIFIRTPTRPANPSEDCYEVNIAPPDNPFPTGSIVQREKTSLAGVEPDAWHTYLITAEKGTVTLQIDGQEVCRYQDPSPLPPGYIGLQLNEGRVEFRDIRIRPLGTRPIFNGKDLTGWSTDQARESRFSVTDAGELRVQGGSGQIESEGRYGDFVLQLECFVAGDRLNSGVFYRCIPGQRMNGYESQIHNAFRDGDRTEPLDGGTGAIYRRQSARYVVPDDREWFTKTIIADGPHVSVWVNGHHVTDWTDTRPPHDNPREGLRTEPGTICIQGHDPTTDLRFRKLRIAELSPE
jgi:hypothetical protein